MKLILIPLFISMSSASAVAAGYAEIYAAGQLGGSNFTDQSGLVEHKKSSNFFTNMGGALGVKGRLRVGPVALAIGMEYGSKEEGFDRNSSGSSVEYVLQMERLLGAAHAAAYLYEKWALHLYAEYDPYVLNRVKLTRGSPLSFFESGDTYTGSGYAVGIGFGEEVFFRVTNRFLQYNKVKLNGQERDLPGNGTSIISTSELVFQIGALL